MGGGRDSILDSCIGPLQLVSVWLELLSLLVLSFPALLFIPRKEWVAKKPPLCKQKYFFVIRGRNAAEHHWKYPFVW